MKHKNYKYEPTLPTEAKGLGEVVGFGEANLFPQYLAKMYRGSATHAACINAKHNYTIGKGLVFDGVNIANEDETITDVFSKCAKDYILYGAYAIEVAKDAYGNVNLYHHDYSTVRCYEKPFGVEKVQHYALSKQWDGVKSIFRDRTEGIISLPAFNMRTFGTEGNNNQLFVYTPYNPTLEYYGLPSYMSALTNIELEVFVGEYYINNIQNGLAPSLIITTYEHADEERKYANELAVQHNYGGTDNVGKAMVLDAISKETAPDFTFVPANANAELYNTLQEGYSQNIMTSHLITSPMLLGVRVASQLGGRDELLDASMLFMNNTIRPIQQQLLDGFKKLLSFRDGKDVVVTIDSLNIFEEMKKVEEEEESLVGATNEEEKEVDNLEEKVENKEL